MPMYLAAVGCRDQRVVPKISQKRLNLAESYEEGKREV